jgi:hypothetical protein
MEDSLHRSKAAFFPKEAIVDPLQEHLDLRIQLKEIFEDYRTTLSSSHSSKK